MKTVLPAFWTCGGPFHQFSIKLQVGHDPAVFAVQVFRGLEFPGAGGQHGNAVLNRHEGAVDFDLTGKVAHGPGDRLEGRIFEHGDPGMIFHPGNQVTQPGPDLVAFPGLIQVPGIAAQLGALFHQNGFIAPFRQFQGGGEAGHAATYHQGLLHHLNRSPLQGVVPGDLGHRHADLVLGLGRGGLGFLLVHPGVLVADVGHFQEIGVQTRLPQGVLEQGFVGPGGAGRDDDAVEIKLLDLLGNEFLGIGGAGEEIVFHRDDARQAPGVFRQGLDVHHPGDVDAAGADKDPDADLLSRDIPFRRIGLFPG